MTGDGLRGQSRMAEVAKIVAMCVVASIAYGVVHDQFTARAYLPYFTEWPPHASMMPLNSTNPTIVGFAWGFAATWWVGLILGIPLALVSTSGPDNWWNWRRLAVYLAALLVCVGGLAALGYLMSIANHLQVDPAVPGPAVPPGDTASLEAFTAVLVAHNISYIGGAAAGVVMIWFIFRIRKKIDTEPCPESSP
jgi:hypothetical protein